MTKFEFLERLTVELKRKNVADAVDVIEEYEQHFAFKLADGYSEEEIAAKLGDPKEIAAQYDEEPRSGRNGKKVIATIGLGVVDFFFGMLCILLYAWEIVMGALIIAFGTAAVALFTGIRESFIVYVPEMPYHCAIILGVAFAALTVLSVVGAIYFWKFIHQLMRSFGRFHKNTLAAASGKATLPSLPVYPQFSAKTKRKLRKIATVAVTVFAVCFIIGFIVCVISAGSLEFWHAWGWFGYEG